MLKVCNTYFASWAINYLQFSPQIPTAKHQYKNVVLQFFRTKNGYREASANGEHDGANEEVLFASVMRLSSTAITLEY